MFNDIKPILQEFIQSRETLFHGEVKGKSGYALSRKYTSLLDHLIRSIHNGLFAGTSNRPAVEKHLAVIAVGSYGRREVCMASDVDLLLLYDGRLSDAFEDLVSSLLYPLWDAKLTVGHAVMTLQEAVDLAMESFQTLTSVMDGRFLIGSRTTHRRFMQTLWGTIHQEKKRILEQLLLAKEKRKERYSRRGYFAEPDLKEGLGGIRDLDFMEWTARLFLGCTRFSHIRLLDDFSHFDINSLHHSRGFLLKVRILLHRLASRREDRLMFAYQNDVAHTLGYQDRSHTYAAERFMRHLYRHMNRVRYGTEEFHTKVLDTLGTPAPGPPEKAFHEDLSVYNGNIVLKSGSLLEKDPLLILEAFREANQRGLFLGSGFIWEARKRLSELGKGIVDRPGAREVFREVLMRPNSTKILRLALDMGLIELFIPEFKKIRDLALFSYYHEETVDLHSIKTVEVLLDIRRGAFDQRWPLLRRVFEEIDDPEWLFLAALLHDIGKGYRGDHEKRGEDLIPRILERLNIRGRALKVIAFLIKHHLLLAIVSQRRDLNEEATSEGIAQAVQDLEVLRLLFLLTAADTLCSGPEGNNDWRLMLLGELFLKVSHILERGVLAAPDAARRLEEIKLELTKELGHQYPKRDILDLMEQAPLRYFLNSTRKDIFRHFRLALRMKKGPQTWLIQKIDHVPMTRVVLRTVDQPGLLSKMVGVFTLNNIKVLTAKIFTLKNGLAFDSYEVTNPLDPYREKEIWKKIKKQAVMAMEGRLPLDALIEKKHKKEDIPFLVLPEDLRRVVVNNTSSDFFSIIEVTAEDRFGLLYTLAKKLFLLGLNIRLAMVDSDRLKMTGVFYVSDSDGQKVEDGRRIEHIKQELMGSLSTVRGSAPV